MPAERAWKIETAEGVLEFGGLPPSAVPVRACALPVRVPKKTSAIQSSISNTATSCETRHRRRRDRCSAWKTAGGAMTPGLLVRALDRVDLLSTTGIFIIANVRCGWIWGLYRLGVWKSLESGIDCFLVNRRGAPAAARAGLQASVPPTVKLSMRRVGWPTPTGTR